MNISKQKILGSSVAISVGLVLCVACGSDEGNLVAEKDPSESGQGGSGATPTNDGTTGGSGATTGAGTGGQGESSGGSPNASSGGSANAAGGTSGAGGTQGGMAGATNTGGALPRAACPTDPPVADSSCEGLGFTTEHLAAFCVYGGYQCACGWPDQWNCSGSLSCPDTPPADASTCSSEQVCAYFDQERLCECIDSQWQCADIVFGGGCGAGNDKIKTGDPCKTPGLECGTCGGTKVCTETDGYMSFVSAPTAC